MYNPHPPSSWCRRYALPKSLSTFYNICFLFQYFIYWVYIISLLLLLYIYRICIFHTIITLHSLREKQEINQKPKTLYMYVYVCLCVDRSSCVCTCMCCCAVYYIILWIYIIVKPITFDNGLLLLTFGSNFYCLQATVINRVL